MHATVSKWGNSLALRIPKRVAAELQLMAGTMVDVRAEDGRLVAEPVEDESLEAMVARITPESRHGERFDGTPRGREVE
jgi:antitoxin MazE